MTVDIADFELASLAGSMNPIASPARTGAGAPRPPNISVPTTKILAIGRWTTKGSAGARTPILPLEMRDTARLFFILSTLEALGF